MNGVTVAGMIPRSRKSVIIELLSGRESCSLYTREGRKAQSRQQRRPNAFSSQNPVPVLLPRFCGDELVVPDEILKNFQRTPFLPFPVSYVCC
jgi:hypothetical protein